jgi:neutral ceramidase
MVPSILPLQLIKLGSLALIAHPGEMTTMAGRRMRKTMLDILGSEGVRHAVVATYAGAFSSYTATREEYAMQHYEGASTLYGPWTFKAYQQENARLARAMKDNKEVDPGPEPPDLSQKQKTLQIPVLFDDKPWDVEFGDVKKEPEASYKRGDRVEVRFHGAHPNNDLRTEDTYLKVEKLSSGKWEAVYTDKDFCTIFRWGREWIANSVVTIEWHIPPDQEPGTYRIKYFGNWKSGWTGEIKEFSGESREFTVIE